MRSTGRKNLASVVVGERYRLEHEMARGGMGTVWVGRDVKLGRSVAVKVMARELAQMSEALARFEREALAVARLRSAHVVQVFDYGIHEGLPYIVMELLEGENLGQRLKRVGRLPLTDASRIVEQICKGLKAAHRSGLIHRDLKPSNIFLARRDDEESVKLLDFGVVKARDPLAGVGTSETTSTGILLGTPQYMSPEQARAKKAIDQRSDLWSVAVIAFRMLTGTNPFRGDSVGDVVLKICSDTLPRLHEHAGDLPPSLEEFFEKAFARDPDDRYQSAAEMAHSFRHFAEGREGVPDSITAVRSDAASSSFPPQPARAAAPHTPLPPPLLTPPASSLEVTPVSTTVGGTPMASKLPPPPPVLRAQPITLLIAGAAASLVAGALVAVLWVDASNEAAAHAEAVKVERLALPAIDIPEPPPPEPAGSGRGTRVAHDQGILPPAALPSATAPAAPGALAPPAASTFAPPEPPPASTSKPERPDWGLGP